MFFQRCAFRSLSIILTKVAVNGAVMECDLVVFVQAGVVKRIHMLRALVSAVLRFLNLQKLPICFINENHFYSNNKVM